MIYTYIVLYSYGNYIFSVEYQHIRYKGSIWPRGFTVQVTYICQNYLRFTP